MAHIPENGDTADLAGTAVADAAGQPVKLVSTRYVDGIAQAEIRLADGSALLVPTGLLAPQADGSYRLPFSFGIDSDGNDGEVAGQSRMRFPVVEETPQVGTRVVDTGRGVRLHKTVSEREQLVDQPLSRDELRVEHVAIGQPVTESALPQTRYEGDTLVVPILEEVLVVRKQLLLKEEVRITRQRHAVHAPQSVALKSEQVTVERFDENGSRRA